MNIVPTVGICITLYMYLIIIHAKVIVWYRRQMFRSFSMFFVSYVNCSPSFVTIQLGPNITSFSMAYCFTFGNYKLWK